LANLGVAQAKRLADRGRSHEAADVLLDLTAFAKDLSSHRQILYTVVGDAIYLTAFEELRRLLVAGKFNAAQMTKLSSSLEIIDRELPRLDAMASKVVTGAGLRLIAKSNRRLGDAYWWSDSKELGWRFSISPRGYAIDAFFQIDPYLQRIAKLEDLPYATAKAEAEAMTAEAKKSTNEYVRDALPDFSRVIDARREVRALLRLVRAATALLLTGEVPMMSDPFGTNLLSRRNAHSITIWSLGRDGTNQNGRDDYGQPDIAIEIPR
jgi:hypothetical protein